MESSPELNIKLIQALKLLTQKELSRYIIFSSSKYFSGDREYSKLLEVLKSLHKSGFRNLNNKTLMEYLTAKLNLNKNTILNRMSELYKIFEMFVLNEQNINNHSEKNLSLLKYYSSKGSFRLFDYVLNSFQPVFLKEQLSTEGVTTASLISELSSAKYFKSGNYELHSKLFSIKSEYEIYSSILKFLKNGITLCQEKIVGRAPDTELSELVLGELPFEKIFKKLKQSNNGYYMLILLIYNMYLAFVKLDETKNFREARNIHKKIKSNLRRDENQEIYTLFTTYCIDQTNHKRDHFYNELFEIIDEKLRDGYFDELKVRNDPVNNFRDYVFIGIKLGKIEWVRDFVKTYSEFLPPEFRQDDINIAYGLIALKERRFEDAIKILNKVKKKNYIYYLDSSFRKLRAYYELKLYYEAFNEIDRIKKYFNYNKSIPDSFIKHYTENLNDIIVLLKYSEKKTDKDDFKIYCRKEKLEQKKGWVAEEVKKILKNSRDANIISAIFLISFHLSCFPAKILQINSSMLLIS